MRCRLWLIAAAAVGAILLNAHLLGSRAAATPSGTSLLFHTTAPHAGERDAERQGAEAARLTLLSPLSHKVVKAEAEVEAGAPPSAHAASCPASRAPYHVLLTASSGDYQRWQTRVFFHHYTRLKAEYPCSDIGGFTRLLTLPDSKRREEEDAGLSKVMTTLIARELTKGKEDLGFVVLNRPTSIAAVLASGELEARLAPKERHIFIVETDHVLLKPLPNLVARATGGEEAAAYPFHYMNPTRDATTINIVRHFAGSDETAKLVQQVGPSPLLISLGALKRVSAGWTNVSFAMKRDPDADAEFNWMLEMWGYSVAAARVRLKHIVFEPMQIEPSSQFGLRMTPEASWPRWYDAGGEPTHHILHYTFSHEYSREGVPMIDNKFGEWRFDKRPYQKGVPRTLPPPPRCAAEAAWTLWSKLNQTMAAAPPGPDYWEDAPLARPTAPYIAERTWGLRASEAAVRLVGTGPWKWDSSGDLYFLRGGWALTPWGTARWGAAAATDPDLPQGAQLVLFLCGVERWTHSIRLEEGANGATIHFEGRPPPPAAGDTRASAMGSHSPNERSQARLNRTLPPVPTSGSAEAADISSALAADDDARSNADSDVDSLRRRLLGTGPWERGPFAAIGPLVFLRGGLAYNVLRHRRGTWSVAASGEGGLAEVQIRMNGDDGAPGITHVLELSCWRMRRKGSIDEFTDFVWKAPARRCFSSCSDRTAPATEAAIRASPLGRVVMGAVWSWGYNSEGVRFVIDKGEGVFISPWGHGRWGFVSSRDDVIFVDFVQEIHMLRFERGEARFVSTRCKDGDTVSGRPLRAEPGGGVLPAGWYKW